MEVSFCVFNNEVTVMSHNAMNENKEYWLMSIKTCLN